MQGGDGKSSEKAEQEAEGSVSHVAEDVLMLNKTLMIRNPPEKRTCSLMSSCTVGSGPCLMRKS